MTTTRAIPLLLKLLTPLPITKDAAAHLYQHNKLDAAQCFHHQNKAYCLPSLLCVGMAKAGTAELRGWIATHPNISVSSVDETQFFNKVVPANIAGGGGDGLIDRRIASDLGPRRLQAEQGGGLLRRLEARMAESWPRYTRMFEVPIERVGRVLTFEKSAGYSHLRRNGTMASTVHELVPLLLSRLLPSAKLVMLVRNPADVVRSRFSQCLRQMSRHRHSVSLMFTKCGGTNDSDFQGMLQRSGVVVTTGGANVTSAGMGAQQLVSARMGSSHGLLLVEDALVPIRAWSAAARPGALLVLFTNHFNTDPFGFLNQVLGHVGIAPYDWPAAQRLQGGGRARFTYDARRSKTAAPIRRPLLPSLEVALRAAYTPVAIRFKLSLPCLDPGWPLTPEAELPAAALRDIATMRARADELRRGMHSGVCAGVEKSK